MSSEFVEYLENQKVNVFVTHNSTEEALKAAIDLLGEAPKAAVTTAIMAYHNTLIQEIQNTISRSDQ